MLRCASSFPCLRRGRLIAAYATVRLIPQDSRVLPAAFLRSRPIFTAFKTFYEVVTFPPGSALRKSRNLQTLLRRRREKGSGELIIKGAASITVQIPVQKGISRICRGGFPTICRWRGQEMICFVPADFISFNRMVFWSFPAGSPEKGG